MIRLVDYIKENIFVIMGYCFNSTEKAISKILYNDLLGSFREIYIVSNNFSTGNEINYGEVKNFGGRNSLLIYLTPQIFIASGANLSKNYHLVLATFGVTDDHFQYILDVSKTFEGSLEPRVLWFSPAECKIDIEEEIVQTDDKRKSLSLNLIHSRGKHLVKCEDCEEYMNYVPSHKSFHITRKEDSPSHHSSMVNSFNDMDDGIFLTEKEFSNSLADLFSGKKSRQLDIEVPKDIEFVHFLQGNSKDINIIKKVMQTKNWKGSYPRIVKIFFYINEGEDMRSLENMIRNLEHYKEKYDYLREKARVINYGGDLVIEDS